MEVAGAQAAHLSSATVVLEVSCSLGEWSLSALGSQYVKLNSVCWADSSTTGYHFKTQYVLETWLLTASFQFSIWHFFVPLWEGLMIQPRFLRNFFRILLREKNSFMSLPRWVAVCALTPGCSHFLLESNCIDILMLIWCEKHFKKKEVGGAKGRTQSLTEAEMDPSSFL